jgi:hypothetical protein
MEGKNVNTSMKLPPPAVLSRLGATKVQELSGEWVELGSVWRERPAAIVWLRHYGCIFCREQAAELRTIATEAEELGTLAIVSTGSVDHGRDFEKTHGEGLRSLVDSERKTYQVLSFKRGGWSSLDPRVYLRGVQAATKGFMQGRTRGDAMQQGGVLVVAAGGEPVFFQRSEFAGDHATLEQILSGLRRAAQIPALSQPAAAAVGR